jgi:hypothetical protein
MRGTKANPIPGPHLVYGFLTTAPNAIVKPIHDKAMPAGETEMKQAVKHAGNAPQVELPFIGSGGPSLCVRCFFRPLLLRSAG